MPIKTAISKPTTLHRLQTPYRINKKVIFLSYYYLRQRGYVIVVVYLFVCLFVSNFAQKLPNGFVWEFSGKLGNGPVNKRLNIDGDPNHGSESVSRHW